MDRTETKPYTAKEVAKFLSLHYTKVYKLINEGRLQATNISTGTVRPNWRISKESLNDFMTERQNG